MASVLVDHLHVRGSIDLDDLALAFADRFAADPARGYGGASPSAMLGFAVKHTPHGRVRDGIREAARRLDASPDRAADALGDGSEVTAPDTVRYALWCAATSLGD